MKNLLFAAMALVLFAFNGNAQEQVSKRKIACYTVSCCGVGPIGIEIWSDRVCYYVYTTHARSTENNKEQDLYVLQFETNESVKELVFENDVIIPNTEIDDTCLILPKGKYDVNNNSITFQANRIVIKKLCIDTVHTGQLLGHEYNYTLTSCVYYLAWERNGLIKITPKLSSDELNELIKSGGEISFDKDLEIKGEDFNYTLKSGKYTVNPDGNIYLENVELLK